MKSSVRLLSLLLVALMLIVVRLVQVPNYAHSNLLFLFAMALGLGFALLKCGNCGKRGFLNGGKGLPPSLSFYFAKKCPFCGTERY